LRAAPFVVQKEKAMVTFVLLLKRKRGLTKEQFRHHYETSHVALAKKHFGHLFIDYRRHYVQTGVVNDGASLIDTPDAEYDAVTTVFLQDKAAVDEFQRIAALPDLSAILKADEERFLDRPAMRMMFCEEVRTWTAADLKQT
jgi:hypothetical protein